MMMKQQTEIALVADLHGNLPAVQALDRDLRARNIQKIWCLGDLVGKGPSSAETFDWAVQHCQIILRGNWDEGIGMRGYPRDQFYYDQLGEKRMKMLCDFPLEYSFTLSGRKIRLLHGRPIMPKLQMIQDAQNTLFWLFEPDYQVVIYADAHRQGYRTLDASRQICNTGSVGNSIGLPMVQYVILRGSEDDPHAPFDLTLVSLPYDRDQAVMDAENAKDMPNRDPYINEIKTGIYSR